MKYIVCRVSENQWAVAEAKGAYYHTLRTYRTQAEADAVAETLRSVYGKA